MNVYVYGQAPSRSSDPARPLSGRSGKLLADLAGFRGPDWYDRLAEHFELRNLLGVYPGEAQHGKGDAAPGGPMREAANRAWLDLAAGDRLVVLGRVVALAFQLRDLEYLTWSERSAGVRAILLPHPSLVNRRWNDEAERRRVSRLLRALVVEIEKERGYAPA